MYIAKKYIYTKCRKEKKEDIIGCGSKNCENIVNQYNTGRDVLG